MAIKVTNKDYYGLGRLLNTITYCIVSYLNEATMSQ